MKKGIFFDLYGTLIDILTDEYDPWVYSTLSRYLSYRDIKITPKELKKTYFEDIQSQLKQSNESYPEVDVYKIFSNMMHQYGNNKKYSKSAIVDTAVLFRSLTMRRFEVFQGVYDVLASLLEKYELALISDAQWVFTEPEMAMLGLTQFFKFRILSSRFGFKKPDVRLFDIAMKKLMIKSEESVYIGDNPPKDLIGAKKAGMKFILFRSEYKPNNDFQPDRQFNDYSELLKIVEEM
jgi:putative hydrolase of the HAD superfamily